MKIVGLEISYKQTPVAIREQLGFDTAAVEQLFKAKVADSAESNELVIISTCNRVELYTATTKNEMTSELESELVAFLANAQGVSAETIQTHAVWRKDETALTHLCRVACGLESQVVGEPQILGQTTQAHEIANRAHVNGPVLKQVFQTAIRCGKRARAETEISHHAASVGSVAVQLAKQSLGSLRGKHVVLVGSGEIGQLALRALRGASTGRVTILNRTPANAVALGEKFGAEVCGLDSLPEILASADIIISATGAPTPIILAEMLEVATQTRTTPILLIDLAVPRDIDPAVADFDIVTLFDMDFMGNVRDDALADRERAIPQVNAIIDAEMANCAEALKALAVEPTICDLRHRAEKIRQRELERTLRHLPDDIDPVVHEQMQKFSRSLINKLLHEPTAQLRKAAKNEDGDAYDATLRELFQL